MDYRRTQEELKKKAILYWPKELSEKEKTASIIPMLLATQDKFISILDVSDSAPDSWKLALSATNELSANLFLKHLMVLSDVSGEIIKRLKNDFVRIFPRRIMTFSWKERIYRYRFRGIPISRIDNRILGVDGQGIQISQNLKPVTEDAVMLLLHGGAATGGMIPDIVKERCIIGTLMGEKPKLERFVKQRYIWVSRITGGATANALGQIAQDYVKEFLIKELPSWEIVRNGSIPGISQTAGETDMTFDIVAHSPKNEWFAIEVSFQFTTNSTIERKSGQAEARANLLHKAGHKIAYVIDGAGNFERAAALANICRNSDCTVAFSQDEIQILAEFLYKQ